jgi:molybdate transport system ATP-binding protein
MTAETSEQTQALTLDVDLELSRGPFNLEVSMQSNSARIAIVGASGAGKTTLLRVLAGLERDACGHVHALGSTWQDTSSGRWTPSWQRQVGWVPQHALLYPHRDVRQNLLDGADRDALNGVSEMLDIVALLDRRPRKLSGGERQRVALGRALLCEPKLLLLDEPFAALDRSLREDVAAKVVDYCDTRDLPLVLVSHDERDVTRVCDEAWEVSSGVVERRF